MIGAIVTVILFSVIVGEAERDQAELELQTQLVRQMRSTINTESIHAVEELRLQDWYLVAANDGDFEGANLSGAILVGTQMGNTNLSGANLTGVDLSRVQFDRNTTLPDGTLWTPEIDMNRFTDPAHPNYWQPDSESAAQ